MELKLIWQLTSILHRHLHTAGVSGKFQPKTLCRSYKQLMVFDVFFLFEQHFQELVSPLWLCSTGKSYYAFVSTGSKRAPVGAVRSHSGKCRTSLLEFKVQNARRGASGHGKKANNNTLWKMCKNVLLIPAYWIITACIWCSITTVKRQYEYKTCQNASQVQVSTSIHCPHFALIVT